MRRMVICPSCGNAARIETDNLGKDENGQSFRACPTCNYKIKVATDDNKWYPN